MYQIWRPTTSLPHIAAFRYSPQASTFIDSYFNMISSTKNVGKDNLLYSVAYMLKKQIVTMYQVATRGTDDPIFLNVILHLHLSPGISIS